MNLRAEQFPKSLRPILTVAHVDFAPPVSPSALEVVVASLVAIVSSLLADALLVALGTKVFPSTRGFVHFQFSDYSKLTVIGVVIACVGWPVVARISSTPRWLFARLAVLVTLVLFVPDAWIWYQGSPGKAVFVLLWMHVAIALVTFFSLVYLAPTRRARHARTSRDEPGL